MNYLPTKTISKSLSAVGIAGFFSPPPIDLAGVAIRPC